MTIITAVQKGDEIAIACDTQTTGGDVKFTADYLTNRSKLLSFGDSMFGFSGSTSIHQVFEDLFAKLEPAPLTSRLEIFRWLLSQQKHLKDNYFIKTDVGSNREQTVEASWASALIVNPHGIFSVNQYRAVQEYSKFWAIGSGSAFALGAMEILYEQPISAREIAEAGALTATKFNLHCAPPVRVQVLQKARPEASASFPDQPDQPDQPDERPSEKPGKTVPKARRKTSAKKATKKATRKKS